MLRIDDVTKIYKTGTFGGKELLAVNDVSFDIDDGEVVSLIGESGSGKSTIGKMILKLTPISKGTITLDGQNVAEIERDELKEYYRRVQGVFQDPFSAFNPIFKADRVFENIRNEFFPGMSDADWESKLLRVLDDVGLSAELVLHKFPHQLSGGQLQRLLIARALLLDVRFLVADEIISMLDASTRIDVLNLLADLKARGLSILFITHDLALGYYISEHAVLLYRGRVVEMGLTDLVFNRARHPYTRMLMACVPRLDREWEDVDVKLRGGAAEAGAGCVYFGRCPIGDPALGCDSRTPQLIEIEAGHRVACFAVEKEMGVTRDELRKDTRYEIRDTS